MNRSISLTLVLAAALASQAGCSKKEDVGTPPADVAASASGAVTAASAAPMDSINSASAVAGTDAASDAASAASR